MFVIGGAAEAQWPERRDPALPHTAEGKVNMTGKAPRQNGHASLAGLWQARPDPAGKPEGVENEIFGRYFIDIGADLKGTPMDIVQPAYLPLFMERLASDGFDDPTAHCLPAGGARMLSFPSPIKIVEAPGVIMILHEDNMTYRQVFTDGRALPEDPQPAFLGYSVGRWERDTLVVTSAGFRDRGWLDAMGHPHSDALRMVERFRRVDAGHLDVDVTLTDPKTLKAPVRFTQKLLLFPEQEVIEYFCGENEKHDEHYVRPAKPKA
jgi:hypothetical protein